MIKRIEKIFELNKLNIPKEYIKQEIKKSTQPWYRVVYLSAIKRWIAQEKGRDQWLTIGSTVEDRSRFEIWLQYLSTWHFPDKFTQHLTKEECYNVINLYHIKVFEPRGPIPKYSVGFKVWDFPRPEDNNFMFRDE